MTNTLIVDENENNDDAADKFLKTAAGFAELIRKGEAHSAFVGCVPEEGPTMVEYQGCPTCLYNMLGQSAYTLRKLIENDIDDLDIQTVN